MFDRFHLPPARLEFVIMTDTHYMLDPGKQAVEFENRRLQSARAAVAFTQAAGLATPFVVHLGDLVQTFPGRPDFAQAVDEAQAQIAGFNLDLRLAPGNHDVGDKPDPTMPAEWATPAALAAHHARFGQSWFSWDWEDLHFVALNSQIMNTTLPEAETQAAWAEADLTAHRGRRQFLFLHMPPYLYTAQEPSLGHYDNLAQPARGWLLDLARRTGVELMCAAHVHFAFYDWIPHTAPDWATDAASAQPPRAAKGGIRYFVTPSPAFTRPGFSELFSSPPPDQQGRNDTPKLGFWLARVQEDGTRLHFMRTGGATKLAATGFSPTGGQRLLTRHPRDLPYSPLGVYLRHPLAQVGDVPVAWPSVIRQRVRNDYPLLLSQEMGVRHLRFPVEELTDAFQRERLALARRDGATLTATLIWPPDHDPAAIAAWAEELLDGVEVQMPGAYIPDDACLNWIRRLDAAGAPVMLAPLQPHYTVAGKQHSRTQLGYTLAEFGDVAPTLAGYGLSRLRALCVARDVATLWDAATQMATGGLPAGLGGVDWLIPPAEQVDGERSGDIDAQHAAWAAQTLFITAVLPGTRIFYDPWVDMDRTMDAAHGLIDRSCNPRPAFHALKSLNTILFANAEPIMLQGRYALDGGAVFHATRGDISLWLLVPAPGKDEPAPAWTVPRQDLPGSAVVGTLRCYDLIGATVDTVSANTSTLELAAPIVLIAESE